MKDQRSGLSVSATMAAYNGAQSRPPVELVVSDDGSADEARRLRLPLTPALERR